jgi:hypothetical protein
MDTTAPIRELHRGRKMSRELYALLGWESSGFGMSKRS